jgi:DNA recombination-mediator protein A
MGRNRLSESGGSLVGIFSARLVSPHDSCYPPALKASLLKDSPPTIQTLGFLELLTRPTLGLLCSNRCPGPVVLETYDLMRKLPQTGPVVIGGFHSPMERQCLELLIARRVPAVLCLARPLTSLRMRTEWRAPVARGELLLLTTILRGSRRVTRESAFQRNQLVASLADSVLVPYVRPGGSLERLLDELRLREKDLLEPGDPMMRALLGPNRAEQETSGDLFSGGGCSVGASEAGGCDGLEQRGVPTSVSGPRAQ